MTIQRIPDIINGVLINCADCVNREVDSKVVDALQFCIHKVMGPEPGHRLFSIHISSASDSHKYPSRHAQGKAVDISRLNGLKMAVSPDEATKYMTKTLQRVFENFEHKRENFGPFYMRKLGQEKEVSKSFRKDHLTHIHWSVN